MEAEVDGVEVHGVVVAVVGARQVVEQAVMQVVFRVAYGAEKGQQEKAAAACQGEGQWGLGKQTPVDTHRGYGGVRSLEVACVLGIYQMRQGSFHQGMGATFWATPLRDSKDVYGSEGGRPPPFGLPPSISDGRHVWLT